MALPLPLLPCFQQQFFLPDGRVNSLGWITFYETGLTVLQDWWTDSDGNVAGENPVQLNAAGMFDTQVYLAPNGYSLKVTDEDGANILTYAYVADIGATFLATQASIQSEGSKGVASTPYNVTASDNAVTFDSATNPTICQLPAAAARLNLPLIIKNEGASSAIRITPAGTETIDNNIAGTSYIVLPAATTVAPTVTLISDGISNWIIASSHGLA